MSAYSYSPQQIARTGKIAQACINNLISENYVFGSCEDYGLVVSSIVRDCAWDEYFGGNYYISDKLVDKLITLGISDEEDWLLKTKNLSSDCDDLLMNK